MTLQPFTVVPPTRANGTPDPPGDMDNTSLQLLALGSSYSVMNTAYAGGADPTGSADSTAAFNASLATGCSIWPPGTYKIAGNLVATPPVKVLAAGKDLVTLKSYATSGDCLRIYTTGTEAGFGRADLRGFTIDGTHASAGVSGLHMGDTFGPHIDDVTVQNFQGAGSKNVWFDNQYNFMEQLTGRIFVRAGTANVVFDNSANPSGNPAGLGSFDRAVFDIFIDSDGVGDGVVFQEGALMFDGRLGIYGNFTEGTSQYSVLKLATSPSYSFTATNASPCVFTAAGSYFGNGTLVTLSGASLPAGFTATNYFVVNASGATFQLSATAGGSPIASTSTGSGNVILYQQSSILQSVLNIGVELDGGGPGSVAPYTIDFGTGFTNQITGCTGVIDFGAGLPFAHAVNAQNSFQFDGPVFGDSLLFRSAGGTVPFNGGNVFSSGQTIPSIADVVRMAPTTAALTGMILQKWEGIRGTATRVTIINTGTQTITFAAYATSNVITGTSCVIAVNSAVTFYWDEFASSGAGAWVPVP